MNKLARLGRHLLLLYWKLMGQLKHKRNNNQPWVIVITTSVDGGHGGKGGGGGTTPTGTDVAFALVIGANDNGSIFRYVVSIQPHHFRVDLL